MTKINPVIEAKVRTVLGRKVKHLRKEGWLPSTVYGKSFTPVSIQFEKKSLVKLFEEVGESGLVELKVDENKWPILFKNPQYDPVESDLVHVDCYKVNLKEKITASVPLELIGESVAVKNGKVLVQVTNEVEVEALPTDLPEKYVVDISKLEEVGETITVADLENDKKVEIKNAADQVIVKIDEPRIEEEPVVKETEPTEVPATAQKSPEEIAEADKKEKEEKSKE